MKLTPEMAEIALQVAYDVARKHNDPQAMRHDRDDYFDDETKAFIVDAFGSFLTAMQKQGPALQLDGIDEYGPRLSWFDKHWTSYRIGQKFYTSPQPADDVVQDAELYRFLRKTFMHVEFVHNHKAVIVESCISNCAEDEKKLDSAICSAMKGGTA